jgi:hypothetical protein
MADLILCNGDIRTQDRSQPKAAAVAVSDGTIVAVGEDKDIKRLCTRKSELIDLKGRLLLPGFTDSHLHFLSWAMARNTLPLEEAQSLTQALKAVAKARSEMPKGTWINTTGLDETRWPEGRLPNRGDLDRVSPDHPLLLRRRDGHSAVVNSLALKLAGIDDKTPDPPGGSIEHDTTGRLSGLLKDAAVELVSNCIPALGDEGLAKVVSHSVPILHSLGITGIHDFCVPGESWNPFRTWQQLEREGNLNLRCWCCMPGERRRDMEALGVETGFGSDRLRMGHLKFFVDGSMGSQTAWMLEPYEDGSHGLCVRSPDDLATEIAEAERAGLSVAIHSIGDRANTELISAFERVLGKQGRKGPRIAHRIEHAQVLHARDVDRLSRLGVIASVQPLHITDDIEIHENRIGERACRAYPFREMLDKGVMLIFGSDCPVSVPNPLWGIHAALTRRRRDGTPKDGWYGDQGVSVAEAVWSYTMGPALACGLQDKHGSISVNKFADLVVLDRNLYELEPMEIPGARVAMTVFDGRIIYGR